MSGPQIDLSFPHTWSAEVLQGRPLIAPARHFVYPAEVEEVEVGALELLVKPVRLSGAPFLATFALGFDDPAAPTGLWSCPDPSWLCAVAGGYAYLIDTAEPEKWHQVEYRPVLEIRSLVNNNLLLFAGHNSLLAWGTKGKAWQSARLSWEGVKIVDVNGTTLMGTGWDLMSDTEMPFALDLYTGKHSGGLRE